MFMKSLESLKGVLVQYLDNMNRQREMCIMFREEIMKMVPIIEKVAPIISNIE